MRRRVAMEQRICPRSRALRNPTETLVARATWARESLRRMRMRRKRWPGSCGASAGAETRPCFFRTWTMAAGFRPRARRRKMVRCGRTRPRASQARNAEEEMASLRATSEMRRSGWRPGDFDVGEKFFLLDTGPGFL